MKKITIAFIFLLSIRGHAQIQFQVRLGIPVYNDGAQEVIQTGDGGYLVYGAGQSFAVGFNDLYLCKTNANGTPQWGKTYGGSQLEGAWDICRTSDGGYIMAAQTKSFGEPNGDIYVVRTDSAGTLLWSKRFGGTLYEASPGVAQLTDGNFVIAAGSGSFGGNEIYITKLDSTGSVIWSKTYGGPGADGANSIISNNDGSFTVLGYTYSYGSGNSDVLLMKADANGNVLWSKTYGGTPFEFGRDFKRTTDGGYIIGGQSAFNYPVDSNQSYLIKTDSSGNHQWSREYGGVRQDAFVRVSLTNDGGYILTGTTNATSAVASNYNLIVIKTDASGIVLWTKIYGGPYTDGGSDAQQTNDGGYIIAGGYTPFSTSSYADMYLIKTDASGNSGCNDTSVTWPSAITPTLVTSPTLTGVTAATTLVNAASIVNIGTETNTLCTTVGINDENENNDFNLSPNPATTEIRIESTTLKTENIEIYDVLGQKVFSQETTSGKQQTINVSAFPSGIYFVKVRTEKEERVAKFVKE